MLVPFVAVIVYVPYSFSLSNSQPLVADGISEPAVNVPVPAFVKNVLEIRSYRPTTPSELRFAGI